MHEQYGPIVRINPNELHIQDSEFFDQLYRRENKLDKYSGQTKMFGAPDVHFTTDSHEVHRLRRLPLASFFSKKSIGETSGFIDERLGVLCRRIRDSQINCTPMSLGLAYGALTTDIISSYALGDCYHLLEREDLGLEDESRKPPPGLFAGLLKSKLPSQDKSAERLSREGISLLIAGSETTAQTLSVTTYHLLANREKLSELRRHLEYAIPQPDAPPSLAQLEAIPYLYACVQEGLRLAYGISGRLMRVSQMPIEYRDWVIPPGVPVGMSYVFIHDDENIFPDHRSFKPERWLEKREDGSRLDRYLTSFGKGDRQCLGINLAQAELYKTIATIFRQFDMELFDTERSTVEYHGDYFNAFPENGGDGVKVMVR
ncbi:MAG: hypothetical protein Q9166_004805 [cf. Caloplaca sp. 2 TL-2023]